MPGKGACEFNLEWLGYTGADQNGSRGNGWLGHIHPEDHAQLWIAANSSAGDSTGIIEVQIRESTGAFHWFLLRWTKAISLDGALEHTSFVALDIHGRKLAEQARDARATEVDAILQHVPTMIWRTTATGEMDYANERYLTVWGRSYDGVKGWGWKDSIHPDDMPGIVAYWSEQVKTGCDGVYQFRVGNPERGYRWCVSRCTAHIDAGGKVQAWYGASFDIQEQKRAEERLSRSEAFLRQSQSISKTGSVGVDLVSGEIYWSDETYQVLEIDPSVPPGFEVMLERAHPDDRSHMAATIDQFRIGSSIIDVEHRLVMRDGRVKYVRFLADHASAGIDAGVSLGVLTDITAAKQVEEANQKIEAELSRITRIATMSEVTASIAHEVNQPLSAILTSCQACLRWINRPLPNLMEAGQALKQAIDSARQASDVIGRLRAVFSRKETERTNLNLNALISATLPLLREQTARHRAAVSMDLAGDLPSVTGDPVQIQQVLINLITNGLQSPNANAGSDRKLHVCTKDNDDGLVIVAVTDDGQGIEADHMERLFDPFFTTKSDGMGMGLSICRSIVEAHNGRMFAKNNKQGGATVGFTLPSSAQ